MLDTFVRPYLNPALEILAKPLIRMGVTANQCTLIGFTVGLSGAVALGLQAYTAALILILLSRVFDGLDGIVARHSKPTDLGSFYDTVADMIFYSAIVFGFAYGRPEIALTAAFLIFTFMGTGCSFLATAIVYAKNNLADSPQKGFFYSFGLAEGTETILFFVLICLMPQFFHGLALGFAALCWLTILQRTLNTRSTLLNRQQKENS